MSELEKNEAVIESEDFTEELSDEALDRDKPAMACSCTGGCHYTRMPKIDG